MPAVSKKQQSENYKRTMQEHGIKSCKNGAALVYCTERHRWVNPWRINAS